MREPTLVFKDGKIIENLSSATWCETMSSDMAAYFEETYGKSYEVRSTRWNMDRKVEEWKEKTLFWDDVYQPRRDKPGYQKVRLTFNGQDLGETTISDIHYGVTDADISEAVRKYSEGCVGRIFITGDDINTMTKGDEKVNSLFEVYVVSIPQQEVVYVTNVIASDGEKAKMTALSEALTSDIVDGSSLNDYQFIVSVISTSIVSPEK